MDILKVENETLVRDTTTGAILETDKEKLMRHRAIKSNLRKKEQTIDSLIERINTLESLIERMTNGNNNL